MAGNDSLVSLFRELVQLTVLDEGSPNAFRVRAYEGALEAISSYPGELAALSERELQAISGVGQSTAKKIREFFEKGTIGKLEELRTKYPPDFLELVRIPGVGPKTLARLRSELGVSNLEELKLALASQKVRGLRGLGAKVEEKLLHAIDRMGSAGPDERRPISVAMPIAQEFVAALQALPEVERAQYCGSLRRLRETVADVDIVAASSEPGAVREAFLAMPTVREVIGSGDTKTSVLTTTGLQVDLRVVEPKQFGAACQYFTGSKPHNIKLRQRALDRGWLLNEYGLSHPDTGEVIASDNEEAIYRALDLPFIPPPMREDKGEIEAAARGELPSPVRIGDVRGDLHVHTTLSGDGRSTLEEIVASAAERGYEYLALTDHAENLAMSGVSREALTLQRKQIDALRGGFPGMTLLHGSELNIGKDGSVDYDAGFRRTLEWRVAGVHSHFDLGRDEQTRRILTAMEDPTVDAIAHLSGRRIGRRPGIELDVDAVLAKAVETNTAIEINAALGRLDATSEVLPARPRAARDVRPQHRHPPHSRAGADGVGRPPRDARLGGPLADRELLASRTVPGMASRAPELTAAASPAARRFRVFLLSPADCSGSRARMLQKPDQGHELGRRLHGRDGAPLGEVFAFVSSLYFRGKLAYARAFARPPREAAGIQVITPCDGLLPPDSALRVRDLKRYAGLDVDVDEPRYRRPLVRHLEALAPSWAETEVVLLGSVASPKYVELLTQVLGERVAFPAEFVGRGDMSRGGLMLRCVEEGRELAYVPLVGAVRHGPRPARLPPAAGLPPRGPRR